jgi:hypothetical protein
MASVESRKAEVNGVGAVGHRRSHRLPIAGGREKFGPRLHEGLNGNETDIVV